ncbi:MULTISPECIES: sigma-w pathway protein ysdB [unclassified Bacillus (in: firmicutes)]|uniref:sigma-w pathway protein ysdB n=1 Tax=unclassified Bacillus (in: firmicutes) TaxID=185979 RepID=UPI0008E0CD31|nr:MULTISPECIES: sigma-w pathway protein ysdB [unclassified Bacillus (in: firmicutes)]SFB17091.1 hypothetical protein SAMN02799634_107105 [Bacillus sp. UNCCL13]SFQ77600.1 hypothetical protein SAMN04488577_1536 [Bacillus sp. cl95]
MILLIRFLLLALFVFAMYATIKYMTSPLRKLEHAKDQKRFYFLDDPNNVRKNFLLTYKGVVFEGEKYLGTTDNSFEVVSIFVWPHSNSELRGISKEDFHFIQAQIITEYPAAKIDWKSPIKEFLNK